jgi:hypothetical protein
VLATHTFLPFKLRMVWSSPPSSFCACTRMSLGDLALFYEFKNFKKSLLEFPVCMFHTDRQTSIKFKVKLCFSLPIYIFVIFHLADHVADFWFAVKFLHRIA